MVKWECIFSLFRIHKLITSNQNIVYIDVLIKLSVNIDGLALGALNDTENSWLLKLHNEDLCNV
jgi:hypothetical protein